MKGRLNIATYILSLLGLIVCGATAIRLFLDGKNLLEIISSVGSLASFFGLVIAIVQISSLKQISAETKRAVQETHDQLVQNISISDVSKAIKTIQQIQMHVGLNRYEAAHLRLQDLKVLLLQFQQDQRFLEIASGHSFENLFSDLAVHTLNMYDAVYLDGKEINASVLNQTLENIAGILVFFESQLKFT